MTSISTALLANANLDQMNHVCPSQATTKYLNRLTNFDVNLLLTAVIDALRQRAYYPNDRTELRVRFSISHCWLNQHLRGSASTRYCDLERPTG